MLLHVKMQKNHKVFISINTSLTEAALNWSPSSFATVARCLFHYKPSMLFGHRFRPIFVLPLSQRFKSDDFVFMQDSAPCSAHRAKATQGDLQNVVPVFFSGKDDWQHCSSHKTGWGPI